jgi:WD40 repeat protein
MRLPRFTILQMLLAAALIALVLGLATSSWRTSRLASITSLEYSPSGKYLAAKYSGGSIRVWDVSSDRPTLVQHVPAHRLFGDDYSPIRFADDATLIDMQNAWSDAGFATRIRSLDVKSGRLTTGQPIPYGSYAPSFAASGRVLALPNPGTVRSTSRSAEPPAAALAASQG